MRLSGICLLLVCFSFCSIAQPDSTWGKKFEQLQTILPTPNSYRTASGAPGHAYWQQRADHDIQVTLDDLNQRITGEETITYFNQSPESLDYLWLQLDQNRRADGSETYTTSTQSEGEEQSVKSYYTLAETPGFDGGYKLKAVIGSKGQPLQYIIQKTMMRINLEKPLKPGQQYEFSLAWEYAINDRMKQGGRSGLEYFPKDDNYLYTIAQFFPRMAVYSDNKGWQHKQFLGGGEFALTFGSYKVSITLPSDYVVAATGTLQNPKEVLTKEQQKRLLQANSSFDQPVLIINQVEAIKNEKSRAKSSKTWVYQADSVRDFAFAASRKFIWDAMAVDIGGKKVMAMSYYPKEGNPLWEEWSTRTVALTLESYSKYSVDYPYPKAISVHTASLAMEFPMICFNYGRPNDDGSYTERTKYLMIGVIIHEIGHNFFPMIINSDERLWAWMDEGLNSFVQYLAELDFENKYGVDFPHRRGPVAKVIPYMSGAKGLFRPIMTDPEQLLQKGNNAYVKASTALAVLRDVVMGPELFDYAFKVYSERWAFKNPDPADFFRTIEDASGFDLDWYWRGWFYSMDHVDISIDHVEWQRLGEFSRGEVVSNEINVTPAPLNFKEMNSSSYREFRNKFDEEALKTEMKQKHFYQVRFRNEGGLVMPLILEWEYDDGTKEREKIPAEIWRMNEVVATKLFVKDKKVVSLTFDPDKVMADVNAENNSFPRKTEPSRFEKFKEKSNE